MRWVTLFLLLLWPACLPAQTVTVRSGEHGAFTRLVLGIPAGTDWEMTADHAERTLVLTFGTDTLSFDSSGVFSRIGTERIAGLAPTGDGRGLKIALACHCDAKAFVLRDTLLVVDISASTRPPETPKVAVTPTHPDTPGPSLLADFTGLRIGDLPGIGPEPVPDHGLSLLPNLRAGDAPVHLVQQGADPGAMQPDAIGGQLAADLALAATLGLLDPAIRPLPSAVPDQSTPSPALPDTGDEKADHGGLARQLAAGLSAIDHQSLQKGHISVGAEPCLPAERLTVSAWVDGDASPSSVLAERRGAVFGEFDRIDDEAVHAYARALVHFGFGAEARAILAMGAAEPDESLVALSFLVEGDSDPAGVFVGQSGCDSAAALWSVLAASAPGDIRDLDEDALLRSFEALPKHLRIDLGPELARRLSDFGFQETAHDVLRRLQRMEGKETDRIALGKAQLALKEGDLAAAGDRLHDLSVAGGPEAAHAVAAAVELADATDTRVPQRIVDLSEAFAVELRNSDDGRKLWQAHVRSQLVNGDFNAAFAELTAAEGIPEEMVRELRQAALKALVERADDVTFLRHATLSVRQERFPPADRVAVQIARRLTGLGFPEVSLDLLAQLAEASLSSEIRLARAEALLALQRPEEAEIILIGQRGDTVTHLRAEARRQMGDHVLAQDLYARLGERDAALDSAWLSGDWADVARSDSVYAPAADLLTRDPAAPAPVVERLGPVDALSDASAETRAILRDLLASTAIPTD